MASLTESDLLNGELEVVGRLVDASNATLFGKIKVSQDERPVVYKPIAGERPLWDFPDCNLASREVAAYIFSRELHFNL
ncbi:MAG: phosphatidylinositol kinase, partial [Actinomycetota bacterium]